MILDHNFASQEIDIVELIKWLQKERAGGAETVRLLFHHHDNANDSVLYDLGDLECADDIGTIKIEAE